VKESGEESGTSGTFASAALIDAAVAFVVSVVLIVVVEVVVAVVTATHFPISQAWLSVSFPEQGAPPASGGEQERTLVVCPGPQELLQLLHADHADHEPSTGHFLVPHSLLSRPSPSQGLPPANGGEHERTLVAEPPPQELLQLLQADHGDHEPSTGHFFVSQS